LPQTPKPAILTYDRNLDSGQQFKRLAWGTMLMNLASGVKILTRGTVQGSGIAANAELISNSDFIVMLNKLRKLINFLFDEKVVLTSEDLSHLDLGILNNFRYSASGRSPTESEWSQLQKTFSSVISHFGPDLKRKARIYELGAFFGQVPLMFLLVAVVSTVLYVFVNANIIFAEGSTPYQVAYTLLVIIWALSQGGLGACAFLGTSVILKNAEEVRSQRTPENDQPAPFEFSDITDRNFLKVRIILGALFGFLFGTTLANYSLDKLSAAFVFENRQSFNYEDMAIIIIPFVIGFSTNLVLFLLNRIVSVIQTSLGLQTRP
jgi:hypothetical protein